jgi:hypothetical protein
MTDMLADGVAWLNEQLKAHASHLITVVRGTERLELSATVGQTEFEVDDAMGVRLEVSDRDFVVDAAEYVFGGVVTEPARGDCIEDLSGPNGEMETYEVMGPGNERPFRYDASQQRLRIHTKKVKIA